MSDAIVLGDPGLQGPPGPSSLTAKGEKGLPGQAGPPGRDGFYKAYI
jgi:hypothetical protein